MHFKTKTEILLFFKGDLTRCKELNSSILIPIEVITFASVVINAIITKRMFLKVNYYYLEQVMNINDGNICWWCQVGTPNLGGRQ